jgi:LysR family transcriptional regulator, nod-box dependent transcriptional activator
MRHEKLDLNLLVALDALLQEQSVSRAADRVFITQPAMSNALARLRAHFQDELVVQVGRRLVLTEKATALKDEVRAILLRISAVTRPTAAFDPAAATRQFRIAASDYFCSVAIPGFLERLARGAPGISVDVLPLSPRLNEDLERGEVDLLVVPALYAVKGYPSRKLFEDDWVCVVWAESAAARRRLTLDAFMAMEHVVKRENHALFPPMDEWMLARAKLHRTVAVRLPQYGLLPLAVVGTERVATVQRRLAEQARASLPLKLLACPFPCEPLQEAMQWHPMREADAGHAWFREQLAAACGRWAGRRLRASA